MLQDLEAASNAAAAENCCLLFRGHGDSVWRIDSKIARSIKTQLFGFQPGEVPTNRAAGDRFFVAALYGACLFKYGGMVKPSAELVAEAGANPELDPWFELMKHHQQHPERDHKVLGGSMLIDWSMNPLVACYFATELDDCDGAIFIWNASATGKCFATGKLIESLERMASHDWTGGAIPGLPMIYCPPKQTRMIRAEAQTARYVAQQDLRWPIEHVIWKKQEELGLPLLIKMVVLQDWKPALRGALAARGIDASTVYPV